MLDVKKHKQDVNIKMTKREYPKSGILKGQTKVEKLTNTATSRTWIRRDMIDNIQRKNMQCILKRHQFNIKLKNKDTTMNKVYPNKNRGELR